jgi:hypothetical protein
MYILVLYNKEIKGQFEVVSTELIRFDWLQEQINEITSFTFLIKKSMTDIEKKKKKIK